MKLTTLLRASTALLALAGVALTPPTPPVPKHPHKSAAVHQGAGAQKLIAKTPRAVVLKSVRLDWDYDGDPTGIVFKVWQGPKWTLATTVTSNACVLPLDKAAGVVWFKVAASNTATHLESL